MNYRLNSWVLVLSFFGLTTIALAQKKGDKSARFLNYTFDRLKNSDEQISDAGQIGLFKNLEPSSKVPADAFYGTGDYGVGLNIYGYAKPKAFADEKFEGDDANLFRYGDQNLGYAGIITFKQGKVASERSYITIPFLDETGKKQVKMVAGKMYCIEMMVSLAEASKFSTNNIGIMFVKNVTSYQSVKSEEGSPEGGPYYDDNSSGRVIYNTKNRVYNAYGDWDKVCNIYRAKGDETGLVIGNFMMNEKTKYETNKKIDAKKMEMDGEENAAVPSVLPMAYYFIDNVRIKEVDTKEKCYCIKRDTTSMIQVSRTVISNALVVSEKKSQKENIEAQILYYGQGENKPDETGKEIIELLGLYLKENTDASVEIIAHNDRAEDSLALEYFDDEDVVEKFSNLSEKRAMYIKERLMEKYEISSSQISITTNGAEDPNENEMPEKGKGIEEDLKLAYNRRVTFLIK
jgi:outer membrane protein OmpA-like peptidoglycan-associated protein